MFLKVYIMNTQHLSVTCGSGMASTIHSVKNADVREGRIKEKERA